jgi:hypothetical protein
MFKGPAKKLQNQKGQGLKNAGDTNNLTGIAA